MYGVRCVVETSGGHSVTMYDYLTTMLYTEANIILNVNYNLKKKAKKRERKKKLGKKKNREEEHYFISHLRGPPPVSCRMVYVLVHVGRMLVSYS